MKTWLKRLPSPIPETVSSPAALARFELDAFQEALPCDLVLEASLGEGWRMTRDGERLTLRGGDTGLLYGAYELIFRHLCGEEIPESLSSSPAYALRMINCWDNMDGSVERGYSGRSLFFEGGRLSWEPERMQELGRMLASVGLNVLCINNVNVHFPGQLLIEDFLEDLARLAAVFRVFGVRLMVSVDFSQPLRHGLATADPLDEEVRAWWKSTAENVYRHIPDLAGFLVKADSENRPGPHTYGRSHAEGANMLAEALRPWGGVVVWRAFVYNCHQDWRDRKTDRPKAAWDLYREMDGSFAENVILQVKHGPFDFQVREPLSPLLLGLTKTHLAMELQLAQEYTGHQIDLYTLLPMWQELFEELPRENIMALAAVSNLGRDENYTGHPLAAVNLFGYGRLAWDPSDPPEKVIRRWIQLTYDFSGEQMAALSQALLSSRRIYEKYTAPLGIGWMITPHDHYGPNPDGYEYDIWGTYHKADRNAVGIDRTSAGTGYLDQYPEDFRAKYASPETCPDLYLLFFHRLPYTFRMKDGRSLIQRIYDDHFEGYEEAEKLARALESLPFPEPDRTVIAERMRMQLRNAREWRDIINTFFHRFSGIDDAHGRTIYA